MDRQGLLERYGKLYTAVVSDALDDVGLWAQVLPRSIQPLFQNTPKMCGYASTLKAVPSEKLGTWLPDTFKRWASAYDKVAQENVLVLACSSSVGAVWGELRTERMLRLGCRGLVTDGLVRDTPEIGKMGFPIYASGRTPSDCRGRLEYQDHNCEVEIGGIAIHPADLILADGDGIMVVPSQVADRVIDIAEELDRRHQWIHSQLQVGKPAAEVVERYSREPKPAR